MLFTLRTEKLNSFPAENDPLPKQQLEIKSEFVYNQNLQLFISAAAKKKSDRETREHFRANASRPDLIYYV